MPFASSALHPGGKTRKLCCSQAVHLLFFAVVLSLSMPAYGGRLSEASVSDTLDILNSVEGISPQEVERYSLIIKSLDYTPSRAIGAFLQLPDIASGQLPEIFSMPELATLRYSVISLLEYYVSLDNATVGGARELVQKLDTASFVTREVLTAIPTIQINNGETCLRLIRRILQLNPEDEAGLWAVKALFSLPNIKAEEIFWTMMLLEPMTAAQKRAAERYFTRSTVQPTTIAAFLRRMSTLTDTDAAGFAGLMAAQSFTKEQLHYWLNNYFCVDGKTRETFYHSLPPDQKTLLLQGLNEAAPTIAERLNSLHDVTDDLGREIGSSRLSRLSPGELQTLFEQLDPISRGHFSGTLNQALKRHNSAEAARILRLATAAARLQLANELTTENLYVLLAHGSELLDSSFSDILIPLMAKRIKSQYHNALLDVLVDIDPNALLTSDFMSHLAWKGCLSTLLSDDAKAQQAILRLMARSALSSEESLLFFAATFTELLQTLQPAARTTLLTILMETARYQTETISRQVRVILQEYFDHHPRLLSGNDRAAISEMIEHQGRIDLRPYTATPFVRWLADGKLSSLSVFMADDDGSTSYRANATYLLDHGYRPTVAEEYAPGPVTQQQKTALRKELQKLARHEQGDIVPLLQLAARIPEVIAWRKKIGSIDVTHYVFIYQGEIAQRRLLQTFFTSGHELFAQRGHSYWRGKQLLAPLEQILREKAIPTELLANPPRFICIGSCGGIRTYTELLRRLGNNVDILATVGTGKTMINTPYNTRMLEIIAVNEQHRSTLSWQDLARMTDGIFASAAGEGYIRPGSLPAILYKMSAF